MCKAIDDIREEGREEGIAAQKVSVAEAMLVDAEPVAKIKKYTKLPLEKLQEMATRLGVELVM